MLPQLVMLSYMTNMLEHYGCRFLVLSILFWEVSVMFDYFNSLFNQLLKVSCKRILINNVFMFFRTFRNKIHSFM